MASPRSDSLTILSKMRRWASRKKSPASMTSAARLNASLCRRMASRTERSASRLCGSVRSATAVSAMSELGRWNSNASEVRTDGNVLEEERRKIKTRIPTEVEIRVLGIRPNRTLALLGCRRGRRSRCSGGTFGNDLYLDGCGHVAMQLDRHIHLAELLDRIGKLQLTAIDVEAPGSQRL